MPRKLVRQLHKTEPFIEIRLSCVGSNMVAAVATKTAVEVDQDTNKGVYSLYLSHLGMWHALIELLSGARALG